MSISYDDNHYTTGTFTLSPQLFVIVMIPLNYNLRKCKGGYRFTKSQEKKDLMCMDNDILFLPREKKEWETEIQRIRNFGRVELE